VNVTPENEVNFLIERPSTGGVELKMSRVKVILVVVMPAFFLLGSADYFDTPTRCGCDYFRCLLLAEGSGKQSSPSADNSLDRVVHRWGRRISVQSATDGFASPVALPQTHANRLDRRASSADPRTAVTDLSQSWQFLYRAALEPRAPSSAS